ncbi:hypothetical protein DIPPA_09122 [Diplonema papillatum]|nr:hypothetical protein DIPPA_09122 [Diplonema papillatum]
MYRGMKRRFKLPLGVGSEFEVTNGHLQGCPLSVILINALLSVALRAVSVRVPEVSSESLADDATLLAPAEAELQWAVDIVARFCALTGMRLNLPKTVAMGIHAGSTQQRRRRPYASAVKVDGEATATATAAKIGLRRRDPHKEDSLYLALSLCPSRHSNFILGQASSCNPAFRMAIVPHIWVSTLLLARMAVFDRKQLRTHW